MQENCINKQKFAQAVTCLSALAAIEKLFFSCLHPLQLYKMQFSKTQEFS